MDSYAPLLEKTRLPQPSLQKLAVVSIFERFRSATPTDSGRDAISCCLRSASAAVVDQSTRELCRLVKDAKLDVAGGLLELQSALEDSPNPQLTAVFVKGIGLLTRLGFERNPVSFRFSSSENHPFVKAISCGTELQGVLLKEVALFIMKCKHIGMEAVCEFLGPFLNYSIMQVPVSSSYSRYLRNLVSTMMAFCCSSPEEAIPIIKLLTGRLQYIPCKNAEEVANISGIFECLADAYHVVLRQLVGMGLKLFSPCYQLVHEAQLCGLELLDAILSLHSDFRKYSGGVEQILDVVRRILAVQKELGLNYCTGLSSVILSLFSILTQSDLEHEQYSSLNILLFLLRWKGEKEYRIDASASEFTEELLFIFPVLALVSSPSRSIKQIATLILSILGKKITNLLSAPKEKQVVEGEGSRITTPGHIVFSFIKNMWSEDQLSLDSSFYVNRFFDGDVSSKEAHADLRSWICSLREYSLGVNVKRKSGLEISHSEESFLTDMPMIFCSVAGVFLLHQTTNFAIDLFAIGSNIEPKLGIPLLLTVLFYINICSSADIYNDFHDMLLKLLALLPSVASHSAMIPLIHQVLLPMLHKDVNPFIKATAIRLICKTWEINDRVFGSLQGMLHPNELVLYGAERGVYMSIAVSIHDVCKRNPDRGVDIILSVAACIEHHDPLVQSIGLQSLAHLCEADVIDFYTAWDVIEKQVQNYFANAVVAYRLALLLRWGAMDAEAYPEAAANVLNILWKIGTHSEVTRSSLWTSAQEAAFRALLQYEVVHLQRSISDFSTRNMDFLFSQTNPDLLAAVEEFEVKLINYEHLTRRKYVKHKRISGPQNKIFKLLDVAPDVIFSSGSSHRFKELPGAALLCFPTRKDVRNQGLQNVHSLYEDAFLEISASLLMSRNILLALLSLQSWTPFMERWLRSSILVLDAKVHRTVLDKTLKAATDILKILTRLAEAAIPRSAENIALALGAFCLVLPSSAHAAQSMASKFLLNWLSQYEHEYRQWSAAISLGLISSCLHVTEHEQRFKNISTLLEVASMSKSSVVKGACGIGLGFSCQNLLTRVDSGANAQLDKEKCLNQETELLKKIVKTLVLMTDQFSGSSAGILEKLAPYFPLETEDLSSCEVEILNDDIGNLEGDAWDAAGPIIGLVNSLGAIYRAGARDAVLYLKSLIISWIPGRNDLFPKHAGGKTNVPLFALGACLSIPTVVSFCHKVELIDDIESDHLVSSFMELISGLLSVEQLDNFLQNLLMSSCVGAGNFMSTVLNSRLPSLKVEHVKGFLVLFRRTYSSNHPPFVRLGGMLGVVNAMGAGAGILIQRFPFSSSPSMFKQKELSHVSSSLFSSHVLETELTSTFQEIFLFAQNSDDPQSQQYAAWAVSVLRHSVFSQEHRNEEGAEHDDSIAPKSVSQGVSEDTIVMKLSLWLMQINYSELGTSVNSRTVSLALRCLSHAPRLPLLDWGAMIRQCMKYGGKVAEMTSQDIDLRKGTLREECFLFVLSHANQFDSLLVFLDELFDVARFKTLESNLQSLMLLHLANMLKIFSNSRIAKLFDDVADFLHWFESSDEYNYEEKISMRVSCWKSLQICLNESAAMDTQDYANNLERCMEVLFTMLSWPYASVNAESSWKSSSIEWTEAIRCLGKAPQGWLSKFLLIPVTSFKAEHGQNFGTLKKVKAKAALVGVGSIPLAELAKLKAYILDTDSQVWNILVEVAVTLQHYDESVRRQWLSDTAEILCVTGYPSTALRFLGLLSGSSCKYMPILLADKVSVLTDLPAILPSLLAGSGWEIVAESVASCLWKATERVHDWVRCIDHGHYLPDSQPINSSEKETAVLLLRVMHQTCVSLKEYLPVDKRLRLANMVVT